MPAGEVDGRALADECPCNRTSDRPTSPVDDCVFTLEQHRDLLLLVNAFLYIVSRLTNRTFHALSHPIRRGVIERLTTGPGTVGEVTGGFGVSKPTITRHLHVLEEAGLVIREIDGRTHRLRLNTAPLSEVEAWLESQRSRWERLFDVVEEYLEEEAGGRKA